MERPKAPGPTLSTAYQCLRPYLLASSILLTLLPMLSKYYVPNYLEESLIYMQNPLSYAVSYDGLIFLENQYEWESNFAFLPGFVWVVRAIKWLVALAIGTTEGELPRTLLVLGVILVNKLLTAYTSLVLYQIASNYGGPGLSRSASVLFLFNPSSVFYHSVYSEPIFACLTMQAIKFALDCQARSAELIDRPLQYLRANAKSLLLFGLSMTVRSTGLFLSLMFGFPILSRLWREFRKLEVKSCVRVTVSGVLTLSIFVLPFLMYLTYGYLRFCRLPTPSPFCRNTPPNIYSYVEDRFWQVGFLSYYLTNQWFQVVTGLLTVLVAFVTLTFGLRRQPPLYRDVQSQGLVLAVVVVALVTTLFANVQSGTRFFSTNPLFYISAAAFLTRRPDSGFSLGQWAVVVYFLTYNVAGVLWFPKRFNWA